MLFTLLLRFSGLGVHITVRYDGSCSLGFGATYEESGRGIPTFPPPYESNQYSEWLVEKRKKIP